MNRAHCMRLLMAVNLLMALTVIKAAHGESYLTEDFFSEITTVEVGYGDVNQSPFTFDLQQTVGYGFKNPGESFSRSSAGLNRIESYLGVNSKWKPWYNAKIAADFTFQYDHLYDSDDQLNPSEAERSLFRERTEIRDLYLEAQLAESLYIKIGHQIVAWGYSEGTAITDVVSVRDQYHLGQASIEDMRYQVPAVKLNWTKGDWATEAIVTYQAGTHLYSPEGHEFDPFIDLRLPGLVIEQEDAARAYEYFLRVSHRYRYGDWALYMADANDNEYSLSAIEQQLSGETVLHFDQDRYQLFGASVSYLQGFWIYQAEMAWSHNKKMRGDSDLFFTLSEGFEERDRIDAMVGAEYNGWKNIILTTQLLMGYIEGETSTLFEDKESIGFFSNLYWHNEQSTIMLQVDWTTLLGGDDQIIRFNSEYKITDDIHIGGLLTIYESDSSYSLLSSYRNNDAITTYISYKF